MNANDISRRADSNPLKEILEPIRRRVLLERTAKDERDGCLVIDHLAELDQPGA